MAEEISKPLCEARKVTMVSSGDGQVGAAKLSGEVLDMMTRIPEALERLTGVSISQVTHSRVRIRYRAPQSVCHLLCRWTDLQATPAGLWDPGRPTSCLLPGPPASLITLTPSYSSSLTSPVYLCYLPVIVVDTNSVVLSLFCLWPARNENWTTVIMIMTFSCQCEHLDVLLCMVCLLHAECLCRSCRM